MKLRPSALAATALLAFALLALFLPWLRLQRPDPTTPLRPLDLARQLAGDDDTLLHGYLLMRTHEWHALTAEPFAGASLLQALNAPTSGPGPSQLTAEWAATFLGPIGSPLRLLWFLPATLALALLLTLLPKKINPRLLSLIALLALTSYLGGRAWANHTLADRALLAIDLGSGWWLTLYLLLPLALLAATRAAAGPKAKW